MVDETEERECNEETWSWWHFSDNQMDPYWIRCTLTLPHEQHEDENTGLTWYGDDPRTSKESTT